VQSHLYYICIIDERVSNEFGKLAREGPYNLLSEALFLENVQQRCADDRPDGRPCTVALSDAMNRDEPDWSSIGCLRVPEPGSDSVNRLLQGCKEALDYILGLCIDKAA